MVRIRLRRVGARNQPSFRIVATDRHSPRDGRFLEILGHYNPRTEPATITVDESRLFRWLENGAQPSESVRRILVTVGAWDRWERYRQGEAIEGLLSEAEAQVVEIDPRTNRPGMTRRRPSKKARAKEAAEVEGAPVSEEPEAEPETAEAEAQIADEMPEDAADEPQASAEEAAESDEAEPAEEEPAEEETDADEEEQPEAEEDQAESDEDEEKEA